ncbi:hypothetical protein [Desertibacillus haloalkaliphilus]|uniref:hypothetical protein n=1 Tax=Desertibacillus haloalkaliphilus TaxID=1328930 RepID=UPI001C267386|nr:hypothetical protein [Desertibacillus haloalkaliphilus]MBU8906629.1 hypothetical protein [Desertibacillus haloalkaliphilus]
MYKYIFLFLFSVGVASFGLYAFYFDESSESVHPPNPPEEEADDAVAVFQSNQTPLSEREELHSSVRTKGESAEVARDHSPELEYTNRSADEIKAYYTEKFEAIQEEALLGIEDLIHDAVDEFTAKVEEGNVPAFDVYTKYYQRGKELEAEIEESFQSKYDKLIHELNHHGYDHDLAEELKEQYEEEKSSAFEYIIESVREKMGI